MLRDLFLEQVSHSTVLAEDVAHYHRLKPNGTNKTLDVLRDAVERSIKLSEDKAIVAERHKNWRSNLTAAISTAETPKAAAKPSRDKKTGVAKSKTPELPKQGEKLPCYFHNEKHHAGGVGCSKGKGVCGYAHVFVSRPVFDQMTRPSARNKGEGRETSRNQKPKTERGKTPAYVPATGPQQPDYRRRFVETGQCSYGEKCTWTHPPPKVVEKLRTEAAAAKTTPPVAAT